MLESFLKPEPSDPRLTYAKALPSLAWGLVLGVIPKPYLADFAWSGNMDADCLLQKNLGTTLKPF